LPSNGIGPTESDTSVQGPSDKCPSGELFYEKEVVLAIQEITSGGECPFRERVLPIISKWNLSQTSVDLSDCDSIGCRASRAGTQQEV
jgi:hypothetical protein